jgi:hypothetical protein
MLSIFVWKYYVKDWNLPTHPLFFGSFILQKTPRIILGIGSEFINIKNWGFLWLSFVLSLFIVNKNKYIYIALFIVIFQLAFYFAIYLYAPDGTSINIRSTFDRFLIHISPVALLIIALAFANPISYNEKK